MAARARLLAATLALSLAAARLAEGADAPLSSLPAGESSGLLPIVTTTTDLKALVEAIGGDRVAVDSLAPPYHDPHAIDVKPGQIVRLRGAALLVRIGLDHEPWLRRVLTTIGDPALAPGGRRDLDLSRGVALLQTETPRLRDDRATPHLHGLGNPHYWLDPENARPMAAGIAAALGRLRPDARAYFDERRRRFLASLDTGLLRWRAALAPHRGARLVAVHDTWAYFAARFGLTVVATVEPHPGVPPSPAALAALVERMRATGVRVLVAEPYASAALVRQIAGATGARAVTLVPSVGGERGADDYLALFDLNVARLAEALAAAAT
ncbi:MAG TPA: metal ABC transporter substrate-binding protein [Methylomirabilota bacterium]|nr:metal ABC transporter substrate-binding protein [Methylomirabilota bacterium]